jgi:hypothetical protein
MQASNIALSDESRDLHEPLVHLFVNSFPGLNRNGNPNFSVRASPNASIQSVLDHIIGTDKSLEESQHLKHAVRITSTTGRVIPWDSKEPLSTLIDYPNNTFATIRLHAPLCGGKGGFGSQLRAAGGRMSKKKKTGEQNGSSRNLDGRRLRTVTEAKALANYLVLKPEMDENEKAERRKRWAEVVEMTERKQEEIKSGGKGRIDGKWMDEKEEATSKTTQALLASMSASEIQDQLLALEEESESGAESSSSQEALQAGKESTQAGNSKNIPKAKRNCFGWEEEELSGSSDGEDVIASDKGKQKT